MKLPDTDEQYDWNEIYSYKAEKEFQGEYERRLSYNKKTYREIEDNKWKTLQACVDWAIQMGNHAAFVRFYLHKAYDQYSFFEFVLEDMLSMYHIKKKEYAAWKIIKNTYWIKKDIADIFADKKSICSAKTLYSWINSAENRMPEKYEIVQMGLYIGLSCEETNQLLEVAGKELLYIMNAMDAICMFYLDFYHNEKSSDTEDHEMKMKRKQEIIFEVKEKVNSWTNEDEMFLKQAFTEGFEERKVTLEGKATLQNEKLHLEEEDIPFFLTRWYETHFRNCKEEESFHDFIKNFDFGIIRYGYTAKTQEFISDKRFQKNLYMPDIEFRADVSASQLIRYEKKENIHFFHENLRHYYQKICDKKELKEQEVVYLLSVIWKIGWLKSDVEKVCLDFGKNAFSKTKELIYGRNLLKADKKRYKNLAGKHEAAYEFAVKSKESLIQFCVACGMEEYIGIYMRLANYWTKDYLKQEKLDEAHMDRKNAFIIYAMKYRDALLLRWEKTVKEKYPDRNTVEFRNKMKDDFPFLQLMLTVNREIQFVSSEIEALNIKNLKRVKNDLIYPVSYNKPVELYVERMWYHRYEKRLEDEKSKA